MAIDLLPSVAAPNDGEAKMLLSWPASAWSVEASSRRWARVVQGPKAAKRSKNCDTALLS